MATYIFETMSAADAAGFTAADELHFATMFLQPISIGVTHDDALHLTSLTVNGKTLSFNDIALASATILFDGRNQPGQGGLLYFGASGSDVFSIANPSDFNVAHGLAGNDQINGGDGLDSIFGGAGSDTIAGNGDEDHLYGMAYGGIDVDQAGDSIDGGTGTDALYGGGGDDTLSGGADGDSHNGGPGNDRMIGGPGNDSYDAQDAGDVIVENPGEGIDLVYATTSFSIANFANVENMTYFGAGGATLTGNSGNNNLFGGFENDIVNGGEGNDSLDGRDGPDTINGEDGDDTLAGGEGNDALNGGDGNDLFIASAGADLYNGGNGTDRLEAGGDLSSSQFQSIERIGFAPGSSLARMTLSFDQVTSLSGTATFVGTAGSDSVRILAGGAGSYEIPAMSFENWTADPSAGDYIVLSGSQSVDYVLRASEGIAFHQYLTGHFGNDQLFGSSRADRLEGDRGHDNLFGGADADTITGGDGNDHLYGQSANGGADGADSLNAGDGSDYLQGNAGNDTLDGANGSDRINGGANDDAIIGNQGNDTVNGNLGNDSIDGGADNDSLRGGQGNDSISGGNGNDLLSGDLGSDSLTGGAGIDFFIFTGQSSLAASPDRIADYLDGTDRLSLGFAPAAVLTGSAQTSLSEATSRAQILFDDRAGNQEVAALAVGSDTYIFYSSTGGATVDSAILLVGVDPGAIGAGDFV